jgi:hypothetical protein
MSSISRGFWGRRPSSGNPSRIPPGQRLTGTKWSKLDASWLGVALETLLKTFEATAE